MRLRRLARSSYASREGRRAARARVKPDLILSVILSARGGSGSLDVTWSACDLPAAWKQVLSKFRNRTETLGVAAEVSPAMEGINNEALIACVEARPALWQAKHKHHKNKHMTRCLWTEVARIVMPDAAVTDDVITALQKRWKSLRDKFRRLLKGLQEEKKSGAGADDVQDDVVWPFFEQMMFLRDTMEYRPLVPLPGDLTSTAAEVRHQKIAGIRSSSLKVSGTCGAKWKVALLRAIPWHALPPVPRHNIPKTVLPVCEMMHICVQDGQEVVQDASCFDDKVNILRLQRDGSEEYAPPGCCDAKGIFHAPPEKKKENH
ncbi:hypothetical protein HPB49_002763 [Dermacentor silvarum]|uniref:Uncharacterized protein n=1 Tax=Dermacentor silvarum TaxID=543639 RepID=A0ACB8DAI1_DERSI|nr:hypothetical protein HPB49_002763 [Dermacentor silvarum]